jgi:hypothetical protein
MAPWMLLLAVLQDGPRDVTLLGYLYKKDGVPYVEPNHSGMGFIRYEVVGAKSEELLKQAADGYGRKGSAARGNMATESDLMALAKGKVTLKKTEEGLVKSFIYEFQVTEIVWVKNRDKAQEAYGELMQKAYARALVDEAVACMREGKWKEAGRFYSKAIVETRQVLGDREAVVGDLPGSAQQIKELEQRVVSMEAIERSLEAKEIGSLQEGIQHLAALGSRDLSFYYAWAYGQGKAYFSLRAADKDPERKFALLRESTALELMERMKKDWPKEYDQQKNTRPGIPSAHRSILSRRKLEEFDSLAAKPTAEALAKLLTSVRSPEADFVRVYAANAAAQAAETLGDKQKKEVSDACLEVLGKRDYSQGEAEEGVNFRVAAGMAEILERVGNKETSQALADLRDKLQSTEKSRVVLDAVDRALKVLKDRFQ